MKSCLFGRSIEWTSIRKFRARRASTHELVFYRHLMPDPCEGEKRALAVLKPSPRKHLAASGGPSLFPSAREWIWPSAPATAAMVFVARCQP